MASQEPPSPSDKQPDFHLEDWHVQLMDCFDEIDKDHSDSINQEELDRLFAAIPGADPKLAQSLMKEADKSGNGVIDRAEWLRVVVQSDQQSKEMAQFIKALGAAQTKTGRIYKERKRYFLIPNDCISRLLWDLWLMVLLIYLAVKLPLTFAFGDALYIPFDDTIDWFFLWDVILNFFTSYVRDDVLVTDGRKIACNYFQTWFLLDLLSSIPFELLTGALLPDMQPAKLLKAAKVAKVLKLLKLTKIKKLSQGDMAARAEELLVAKGTQSFIRVCTLVLISSSMAHVMACLLISSGDGFLDGYQDVSNSLWSMYLAALYWSMMTMTTVGYGDIIPHSDAERFYAIIAMVFGASMFGYIVGCITSVVSESDDNLRTYYERMDAVHSWLDFHAELPKDLKRRVRTYFKNALKEKPAVDSRTILEDLPAFLRKRLSSFLVDDVVRFNPLIAGAPKGMIEHLVCILEKRTFDSPDVLAHSGEPGAGMFMIAEGVGHFEVGHQWTQVSPGEPMIRKTDIVRGDSFGEEILLGLEDLYRYTIIAAQDIVAYFISEASFVQEFAIMPDVIEQLRRTYKESLNVFSEQQQTRSGKSSLIHSSGCDMVMLTGFPDTVLEHLSQINERMNSVHQRLAKPDA
eukprot:gnl/TRDRNA2_/TRDRNA2_172599_c2_seq1.p1 gnl/TRDRNA2_/TRDRNA2_172599_c2~~gnl/TRDRNA2_/TRDRNA2_172599_c2_seq1.p1  ORF type:complete len:688 (-),score=101.04 gnl/TRDRNA2_/TRDRNA2_172599_c2_seq1:330-2222(-)